ncbi:MAG: Rid family detoxifying hydrolase [Candidatus Roizmanbacteria bacterium]|nr:Rid family detoxifying hydrolase [Candidatus Roizmanbacteria bacterium]
MKYIHTDKAPNVVGPYSQAIATENLIFCSGQIGIDPNVGKLVEGIENQTKQVMENLKAVLEESGSSLDKVVKCTVYLADINDYVTMNGIYGKYFTDHKPARAAFAVAALPAGALIEIEMIAVK